MAEEQAKKFLDEGGRLYEEGNYQEAAASYPSALTNGIGPSLTGSAREV